MDYSLGLMAGINLPIPEIQATLHQPSIKEIAFIGEKDFFIGVQCLCIQKTMFIQDKSLLSEVSNFQIFMKVMNEKETVDKKQAVEAVLTIIFPDYKVLLTPRSIMLMSKDGSSMIDDNNFEALQKVLGQVFCLQGTGQDVYNPANEQARRIAEKLMRGRQIVAEQKAAQEGGTGSVFAQYLSTLTIGVGSMSLEDCANLTMYQLYDLMERYSLYVNWDIDMKSRLAGAKPDKPAENWMKNIHDNK